MQTLSLFPEPESPLPAGIARLAAAAEPLETRNVVAYAELEARSILSRCTSARVPFDWTLNPYRGCEFGCHYCYARYTHEFMELRGSHDFERKIFIKRRAAALLRRDLRKVGAHQSIAIGTATDPYQPAERDFRVTQSLLEVFAEQRDRNLGLITKSALITRDLDVLKRVAARNRLRIRLTITTLDASLARALEPRAPRPDLRLAALAKLAAAGLEVGVMCAPVLPAITDSRPALEALAYAARAAGARFFSANPLFLQPAAQARFFPFLETQFPDLVSRYRRAYARSPYLRGEYPRLLQARVARIRAAAGFPA
ncbi:MAG TPA: radical SAM protein [Terriglobales bacterium]|nr:radical SAM protein [Terriglobales bacterium]